MTAAPEIRAPALIPEFPPRWAEVFGEDDYGIFTECSHQGVTFVWRWIHPGRFLMGSGDEDKTAYDEEKPQHEVTITPGFWLGETPVTQAQWEAITSERPSHFQGEQNPVERITWNDSVAFAQSLQLIFPGLLAALPTEAQWEYACRAGTASAFHDGSACTKPKGLDPALDRLGWFNKNSGVTTYPVKLKAANPWGLFDLHGNVWEWCRDSRRTYTSEAQQEPIGVIDPNERIVRGGSWINEAQFCRSAFRGRRKPSFRHHDIGFRLSAAHEPSLTAPREAAPQVTERPPVRIEGRDQTESGVGDADADAGRLAVAFPAIAGALRSLSLDLGGFVRFEGYGERLVAEDRDELVLELYLIANAAIADALGDEKMYTLAAFQDVAVEAMNPFDEDISMLLGQAANIRAAQLQALPALPDESMQWLMLDETESGLLFQSLVSGSVYGFQKFLQKIASQSDCEARIAKLTPRDLERLHRFAFDYGNGGWQSRLRAIFGRVLGPKLTMHPSALAAIDAVARALGNLFQRKDGSLHFIGFSNLEFFPKTRVELEIQLRNTAEQAWHSANERSPTKPESDLDSNAIVAAAIGSWDARIDELFSGTRTIFLSAGEVDALFRQPTDSKRGGGFQSLLVKLQSQCDRATGRTKLQPKDLERISRYAFEYRNGGWQNRLSAIFARTLGPRLGR